MTPVSPLGRELPPALRVGAHVTLRHRVLGPAATAGPADDVVDEGAADVVDEGADEGAAEGADGADAADGRPALPVALPPGLPADLVPEEPDESLADQVLADLVGTVVAVGPERSVVRRAAGPAVSVRHDLVIAVRELPAAPRPARAPDRVALEQIAAAAWPATDAALLGDWLLRASGGWTRRANSALVVGSPGMPLRRALDTCRRWYADHGLPPLLCVPLLPTAAPPAATDAPRWLPAPRGQRAGAPVVDPDPAGSAFGVFAELGWTVGHPTLVLTARSADVLAAMDPGDPSGPAAPGYRVRLDEAPGRAWLHDYRGADVDPAAAGVLAGPPPPARVRFATLLEEGRDGDDVGTGGGGAGGAGRALAGRGRAVTDRGWVGLSAVGIAASGRRGGRGRALVAALLLDGLRHDGVRSYVQVEREDVGAVAFWTRLGYERSHEDVYLTGPV